MKRASVGCAVVALLLTCGPMESAVAADPPQPGSACGVRALPVPPGIVDAAVETVDPTGRWRAGSGFVEGEPHVPLVWHNDEVTRLVVPVAWSYPHVTAIASNGDLVGTGTYDEFGQTPFARISNRFVSLSAQGFTNITATGIDERGHIVGFGDDQATRRPLQWDVTAPDDPFIVHLPYPPGTGLTVSTNSRGTMVVSPNSIPTALVSYVIKSDRRQHILRGTRGGGGYTASSVSGHWAAGKTEIYPGGGYVPIRWDLSNGYRPEAFRDEFMSVVDVDPKGRLAGSMDAPPYDDVITDGVTTTALDPLVPGGQNVLNDLSNRGRAYGYSTRDDLRVPVEWTCDFPAVAGDS